MTDEKIDIRFDIKDEPGPHSIHELKNILFSTFNELQRTGNATFPAEAVNIKVVFNEGTNPTGTFQASQSDPDSTHIPFSLRKQNKDDDYQGREHSYEESKRQDQIEEFMRRLEGKAKTRTGHERSRSR